MRPVISFAGSSDTQTDAKIVLEVRVTQTKTGHPMGHIRLGTLSRSKKWLQVVEELAAGADVGAIAGASAEAAEVALSGATDDPIFGNALWLLTQIPLAARGPSQNCLLRSRVHPALSICLRP